MRDEINTGVSAAQDSHRVAPAKALLVTRGRRQKAWGERWLTKEGFEVRTADNVQDALDVLAAFEPCVTIVDAGMHDVTGRALFELVREKRTQARVMALCRKARERNDVARFRDIEIVRKPFDWQLIARRATAAAESSETASELDAAREALKAARLDAREAAKHVLEMRGVDRLTGLPGRERFVSQVARAPGSVDGATTPAVIVMGIDRFDLINEAVGHAAGNQVLQEVAERLVALLEQQNLLSESETTTLMAGLARVGGVRFGLLLSAADANEIERIASAISAQFREAVAVDGQSVYLAVTIGAAHCVDAEAPPCNLLGLAEQALDQARAEDAEYRLFDAATSDTHARSLVIEDMLQLALHRQQLKLIYQPIMDWHGRSIVAVETLLRWVHPDIGEVSPEEFMPVAERSGLVAEVNEFVIRGALRQVGEWSRTGEAPARISINLSHAQLMSANLVDQIGDALRYENVEPHQLQIEVREHDLLNKGREVFDIIHQLKGIGIRVAVDQFGAGAFSVALLEELPLDGVKIERSRVTRSGRDRRSEAIGAGIVAIAKRLDLTVTAVGIETDAQIRRLRNWGCDEFQGNLFSAPVAAGRLVQSVIPGLKAVAARQTASQATVSSEVDADMRPESRPSTA